MKRPLWQALIPARTRHALVEQMQALIASRADPLEARMAACLAGQETLLMRLQRVEARISVLETDLAEVRDSADHAERVAMPSVSSRTRTLEQKVQHFETVEARMLHQRSLELRRDLDLLTEDARRMFEYWEVRTDNIYASLASRLPELARREDEP